MYSSVRNPLTRELSVDSFSNLDLSQKAKNPDTPHSVDDSLINALSYFHLHLNVFESPTSSSVSRVNSCSFSKKRSDQVIINGSPSGIKETALVRPAAVPGSSVLTIL